MPSSVSVFLDFNLPNATTWFYFSLLLAVALFFKFSRLLCVRNLDVVMMFLLAPGLLIVQTCRPQPAPANKQPATHIAALIGHGAMAATPAELAADVGHFSQECGADLERFSWLWLGYLWLLAGSVYFFCRCLLDLALVQRPALGPNLQTGGLAWLAGALLICLLAVAYRQVERHTNPLPATPGATGVVPVMHPADQLVFAAAILWRDWPAWSVAALAFAGHVMVVVALVLIGWRHFQDIAAGMAAATFYLLLPYTGAYVGQIHHVLPMALFLGTVLTFRLPAWTGFLLGIAAGVTYFPLFVLPVWLGFYRDRGAGRFLVAFLLGLSLALAAIGVPLWQDSQLEASIALAMDSAAWQPWKTPKDAEGFWTGIHWAYRIPVFLLFLSFVFGTLFWPTPKNLAHVVALSAAVFIGVQWWSADQGGVYILWYVPLLLLLVFRPNLQDRAAPPINTETDWISRAMRWCARLARRVIKLPEPAKPDVVHTLKNGDEHPR